MKTALSTTPTDVLVSNALTSAISYPEFMEQMEACVAEQTSSAPEPSESFAGYTKLNLARMKRLAKTIQLPEAVINTFKDFTEKRQWLVITESWCGDAAQTMPIMQQLADLNPSIELKVVYRDQNPELMDAFLTEGTRSIPILINYDPINEQVLGHWGPRPTPLNERVKEEKEQKGGLSPEFRKELQLWYNKDKGITAANDLKDLLA
jgi:thiol-disulfide isomerase/thioredoxin